MRLGYVGAATAHPHSASWWAKNGQDPDRALHLVRTWAWSPWMQECQQRLGHALHEQTPVPTRTKELAIARVCGRHASAYELYHHAPLASASGVADELLALVTRPTLCAPELMSDEDGFVVAITDAIDETGTLTAPIASRWPDHLTADQLVALVLQIGYWGCNARFANAMALEAEPWLAPPAGRHLDPGPKRPPLAPDATDSIGGFGVPALSAMNDRQRDWLARWPESDDRIVRLWSWVPDVQVANQRMWDCITSGHLASSVSLRRATAMQVAAPGTLLGELIGRSPQWSGSDLNDPDTELLHSFVAKWLEGGHITDDVFAPALERFGRPALVEIQLITGWMRAQASLAMAAGLTA